MSPPSVPTGGDLESLTRALEARGVGEARLALVLGSGLGGLVERLEDPLAIPGAALEGLPASRVAGHAGRLVLGTLRGVRILVQQGRVHLYEGWTAREVARAVRSFCRLGIRGVVLTNAAGGLRADWPGGTLMRITDHLNLQGTTPLDLGEAGAGNPYDPDFGEALERAGRSAGVPLQRGVYAGLLGPSYETPAEVRLLQALGADAVGMSTVAEALAARAEGARVAGLSLITNQAAGIAPGPLSHRDVVDAGRAASAALAGLLEAAVGPLSEVL